MTQAIETLLALQEIDIRIRDLERGMRDIPAHKKGEEGRLAQHRQEVAAAEQALKVKQAEIKKLELEGASRDERISKLRSQQLDLKTNKEFKALDSEIETVKREIGELETREIGLMEELDALKSDLAARQAALATEKAEVDSDVGRLAEREAAISGELAELKERHNAGVVGVDPEWLARYQSVLSRKDRALVKLDSGICGGCHMKLPPSVVHACLRGNSMVTCNYCGRLLY